MSNDVMTNALRWVFWGVVYLTIAVTAMVFFLAMLSPYLPGWAQWSMFAVFLFGIALDVRHKQRTPSAGPTPPDGDLTPVARKG